VPVQVPGERGLLIGDSKRILICAGLEGGRMAAILQRWIELVQCADGHSRHWIANSGTVWPLT